MFGKKRNIENMKLLKYVETDTEACVVASLLDSCGIYSYMDYDGIGGSLKVVIGNTNLGVNIYVKPEDYDSAKAIIDTQSATLYEV